MKLAIRLECSESIGAGHLSRCATIAQEVVARGGEVEFWISPKSRQDWVENRGFSARIVPEDAILPEGSLSTVDLLIIDHYKIDARLESQLPASIKKVLVVDDLADRQHVCDGLLDHNAYLQAETRYSGLLKSRAGRPVETLLGARYALIREGFNRARVELESVSRIKKGGIWVNFGGGAVAPFTLFALQALDRIEHGFSGVTVVANDQGLDGERLKKFVSERSSKNWKLFSHLSEPEREMKTCSIALGSGGVSAMERAMLGLPSFVVATYSNQFEICENLRDQAVIRYFGQESEARGNPEKFRAELDQFLNLSDAKLAKYREIGLKLVDGQGVFRVLEWIETALSR